ncbi:putative oxidoreductase [Paracoccus aminovorans]|uniref:Putative oxidoreductase n=1 Tax=Paracoccus aminovorans TaxID=34004 RepID=A0A1I2XE13_9RHOB|nr:DoxX family protein [Paracoccus aminovorans]CQR85687.1 putative membrane protein [Paracoccus aminovorans]SFH11652.1 putative oxidoreductase [Paracoccus aminovorans]
METGLFIARLFLGVPFIAWGILKLRGGEAKIAPMIAAMGIPDAKALAWLVGLCELLGGLAVVLGYPVRTAALLLGLWCLVTGYLEHRGNATELLKNVTMAGGYFALAAAGGGALALFGGAPAGVLGWLP